MVSHTRSLLSSSDCVKPKDNYSFYFSRVIGVPQDESSVPSLPTIDIIKDSTSSSSSSRIDTTSNETKIHSQMVEGANEQSKAASNAPLSEGGDDSPPEGVKEDSSIDVDMVAGEEVVQSLKHGLYFSFIFTCLTFVYVRKHLH